MTALLDHMARREPLAIIRWHDRSAEEWEVALAAVRVAGKRESRAWRDAHVKRMTGSAPAGEGSSAMPSAGAVISSLRPSIQNGWL